MSNDQLIMDELLILSRDELMIFVMSIRIVMQRRIETLKFNS